MLRKNVSFKLLLVCFLSFSSCQNVFTGMADKTSDEALYEDALKAMDVQDYNSAVAYFNQLSDKFTAHTTVLENWAGALAGQCGLNFINYMNALSTANLGATTFFKFLTTVWSQQNINPSACYAAELKIKQIWTSDSQSASQQLFMAILSMVKMGTYIRSKADNAENGGLGNGTIDGAYNSCSTATPAHNLTDAEVTQIITGFSLFLTNIASFTASLSGSLSGALGVFNDPTTGICATVLPAHTCDTTDPTLVTATQILWMRRILKADTIGIESCAVAGLATCC